MRFLAVLIALFTTVAPVHADGLLYSNSEKGYELELGALDPFNSDPLLGTSQYFGIRKYGGKSGRWFDWSYDSKLFLLDLEARYGPGSKSESETMTIGSAMGQVGRAYHLFGPIDVGWSVMGIMRASDMFPNLSLDETVGVRFKLNENHAMGYFTGLTQSAVEGGRTWTETLKEERTAVHDAIAFWGDMRNDLGYRVELGRQQNATTNVESLSSSLLIPSRYDDIAIRARIEEETGDSIEFHRKRTSLGSEFRVSRNWDMGVDLGVDEIDFGGVESKSKSLMLSFRYNPKKSKSNLRFRTTHTARSDSDPSPGELPIARKVYDAVLKLDNVLVRIQNELNRVDPAEAAQELSDAIAELPPLAQEALEEELGGISAERIAQLVQQAQNETNEAREELARIAGIVGDKAVIERLAVRAARKELYATVARQEIDILGKTVPLSPPQLIALAHAYNLSNDPLPPVTSRDIDNWINDECSGPLKNCLLSRLPSQLRPAADEAWDDDGTLQQSVQWAAELAKREVNRMLLNVMLAAEQLDALTVGGGRRPGEMNRNSVMGSFESLDSRQSKSLAPLFAKARARIQP